MIAFVLGLLGTAFATEPPPVYEWPEGHVDRFYIVNSSLFGSQPALYSSAIDYGRLTASQIELVVRCERAVVTRAYNEVHCTVDDFSWVAHAEDEGREFAQAALATLDDELTGGYVEFRIRKSGRLKWTDIEGPSKDDEWQQRNHEMLRILVAQAFSGFDMQWPTGELPSHGGWFQRHPVWCRACSRVPSQGRTLADDPTVWEVETRLPDEGRGRSRWDSTRGLLLESEWTHARQFESGLFSCKEYSGSIRLLQPHESPPTLPASDVFLDADEQQEVLFRMP